MLTSKQKYTSMIITDLDKLSYVQFQTTFQALHVIILVASSYMYHRHIIYVSCWEYCYIIFKSIRNGPSLYREPFFHSCLYRLTRDIEVKYEYCIIYFFCIIFVHESYYIRLVYMHINILAYFHTKNNNTYLCNAFVSK